MYLGVGDLGGLPASKGGKKLKSYAVWSSMLDRCYSEKLRGTHKAYEGCKVSDEWLYYPKFLEWFNLNYRKGFQIDKDLRNIGSRIYCEDSCSFIPSEINSLTISCKAKRGVYPQGVTFHKGSGLFMARFRSYGKDVVIGYFKNDLDAFHAYRGAKTLHIIKVANSSFANGDICAQVFNNLINWEIKYED